MRTWLCALLLAFAATAARGAVVVLKEGGRLTGTVVSADGRDVVLDTTQGRVRIDAERVLNIDYRTSPAQLPPFPFDRERHMISFGVGLAAPLSSVDFSGIGGGSVSNGELGPLVGAQYLYFATPRVGCGVEVEYALRSTADSFSLVTNGFSHVSGDSLLLLGDLEYTWEVRDAVRPYVLFGAGAHRTGTTVDTHPAPGFAWSDTQTNEPRRLVDGGVWGAAASVRLGFDFGWAPVVFGLEAGWAGLLNGGYEPTGQGRSLGLTRSTKMLNYFMLAGRWGWSW